MRLFLKYTSDQVCIKGSTRVALVIGTVLFVINHFDELVYGTINTNNMLQIGLTYMVLYFVSTYDSAMRARHIELNGQRKLQIETNNNEIGGD